MLYADDTQVYKSFDLDDCLSSIHCVEKGVSDVKAWTTSNKLQMNEDKTDVLLVTAKRIVNLQHLPEFRNINGICIKFSPSVPTGALLSTVLFYCISPMSNFSPLDFSPMVSISCLPQSNTMEFYYFHLPHWLLTN